MHRPAEPEPPRDEGHARDPREIITPDAFSVAPGLLGRPLAHPYRRGLAMGVDLALVLLLSHASGVFLGLAAALVFFRLAGGGAPGTTMKSWLRGAFGCLGAVVMFVTVVAIWSSVFDDEVNGPGPESQIGPGPPGGGDAAAQVQAAVGDELEDEIEGALAEVIALRTADDPQEARIAARRLILRLRSQGVALDEAAEALQAIAATGMEPWAEDAIQNALAAEHAAEAERRVAREVRVDSLLAAYAEALAAGDTAAAESIRPRVVAALSSDELEVLRGETERLRAERRWLTAALEEAERDVGLLPMMSAVADDVGIGFGWAGLYFTVFLALWGGRTPGKRLLRLRVLRLDGKPISWWVAFNRFGGYAASIFTGLLGFAEMFWDPNRQALHDRIAATVVVQD